MRAQTGTADPGSDLLGELASRYWGKIHSEGLCPHDPYAWVECSNLADELEHLSQQHTIIDLPIDDLTVKRAIRNQIDTYRANAAALLRSAAVELDKIQDLTSGTRKESP